MKVVLNEDVDKLGKAHDIVEVKNGYVKNYLLPKKLAVVATKSAIDELNAKIAAEERNLEIERERSLELVKLVDSKTVSVTVKLGENGKTYGSITSKDVSGAIKSQLGQDVDKKKIVLPENIGELGPHKCEIRFFSDIIANITVEVNSDVQK